MCDIVKVECPLLSIVFCSESVSCHVSAEQVPSGCELSEVYQHWRHSRDDSGQSQQQTGHWCKLIWSKIVKEMPIFHNTLNVTFPLDFVAVPLRDPVSALMLVVSEKCVFCSAEVVQRERRKLKAHLHSKQRVAWAGASQDQCPKHQWGKVGFWAPHVHQTADQSVDCICDFS